MIISPLILSANANVSDYEVGFLLRGLGTTQRGLTWKILKGNESLGKFSQRRC
jgi:hypothetical protein